MVHGKVKFAKGIEIGQIFKLGTIYSEKMNGTYLDENGKAKPYIMGCYGIGVSRLIAAIIEQNNDENGIIWPKEVAPYLVHLVCLDMKKDVQKETAEKIYNKLLEEKVEVLYDDRIERPGVKFNDADLIGLPIQIIVGRKADEGIVEIKVRKTGEREEVLIENLYKKLHEIIENLA
jgi:proline--tRNA ligase